MATWQMHPVWEVIQLLDSRNEHAVSHVTTHPYKLKALGNHKPMVNHHLPSRNHLLQPPVCCGADILSPLAWKVRRWPPIKVTPYNSLPKDNYEKLDCWASWERDGGPCICQEGRRWWWWSLRRQRASQPSQHYFTFGFFCRIRQNYHRGKAFAALGTSWTQRDSTLKQSHGQPAEQVYSCCLLSPETAWQSQAQLRKCSADVLPC